MKKEDRYYIIWMAIVLIFWIISNFVIVNTLRKLSNIQPSNNCAKTRDIEAIYDELYQKMDFVDDRVISFWQEIESDVLELLDRIPNKEYSDNIKKCEKILANEE